jgi:type III secretion system FlhB-like substrate exporter
MATVKGQDATAIYIRELAVKFDVPIFEDKELARALYPICVIDRPIPPEFYMAVAQIIAQLMKEKQDKNMMDMINKQMKKDAKSQKPGSRTWNSPGGIGGLGDFSPPPGAAGPGQQPPTDKTGPSSIFD